MIGASRTSISNPGTTLFDSDIMHQHTVRVRISAASRKRDLDHDWIHSQKEYIEVELSEAQDECERLTNHIAPACDLARMERLGELVGVVVNAPNL
jgi:hypothetical protein